jgi:GNAT superfamily N-acetyltransferase
MESVRFADPSDAEAIAELCAEAINTLKESANGQAMLIGRTGLIGKALSRPGGLARLLADTHTTVLVGLFEEVIVGFAVAHSNLPNKPLGDIDAIYVTPGARGIGVGQALLDSAVKVLANHGCINLDVNCLPGDRGSKRLMESSGFKARQITMTRHIGR